MYKVDLENKKLIKIPKTSFSALSIRERFDIQEWIEGTPQILGEDLLIIGKELVLPSGRRLDLLAVDKQGALVVIELKRDDSGSDVEWQAIKYVSYCSSCSQDEIYMRKRKVSSTFYLLLPNGRSLQLMLMDSTATLGRLTMPH